MAEVSHLIHISDSDPGITRKRKGKGFMYVGPDKKIIRDTTVLERIHALVIPPMWEDVWICSVPNGYLQCTGKDQKNRKQYIYHPAWVAYQQQNKYDKLYDFGVSLCGLRERIQEDLKLKGWPKEKVSALIVDLLDHYFFRVGNEQYVRENESYGLTTLRRNHMKKKSNGEIVFSYKAKSGKYQSIKIDNKKTAKLIKGISELPGYEIFHYLDENGVSHRIESNDVNNYIREISGGEYTAKDFRTWGGTKKVLQELPNAREAIEQNPKLKAETQLVKSVSGALGNTISVCRCYYIHPKVLDYANRLDFDSYSKELEALDKMKRYPQLDKYEKLVLKILSS